MTVEEKPTHLVEESSDSQETPRRIAVFPQRLPVRFEDQKKPGKLVMTFPNLVIREVICLQLVVIVVALMSLVFDAPLEELANPQHTPNPAKAPWYFLGIQELLHSFPPIVAGVIIPTLAVVGLVVIPYVNINVKREGLWLRDRNRTVIILSAVVILTAGVCVPFHAYSIVIPSLLLYGLAVIPYLFPRDSGWINWLGYRSLSDWIMTWFVVVVTVLTIIGTYFRGPAWSWIWPWK